PRSSSLEVHGGLRGGVVDWRRRPGHKLQERRPNFSSNVAVLPATYPEVGARCRPIRTILVQQHEWPALLGTDEAVPDRNVAGLHENFVEADDLDRPAHAGKKEVASARRSMRREFLAGGGLATASTMALRACTGMRQRTARATPAEADARLLLGCECRRARSDRALSPTRVLARFKAESRQ